VISAVYHNRLKRRMPLQADPTVQYARGQHTSRVLYRDLELDSPYKPTGTPGCTRPDRLAGAAQHRGGPLPGTGAVPVLRGAPGRHHEFRTTFAEHTKARLAIRKAQQEANERAGRRSR
jgi:UPF0755 protein